MFIMIPVSLLVLPFHWGIRLQATSPYWKMMAKLSIKVLCLCRETRIDRRPINVRGLNNPPGLYIANHQSFMDIPLMLSDVLIPPIMKKELLYIPLFGICAYSSGSMIVDRRKGESRRKVFRQAQQRLNSYHKNLQYYPEGTRQKGNKPPKPLDQIKKPLMIFAFKNNTPVYPISMYGTPEVLSSIGLINYGRKVGKIMHAPCYPADYENEELFCIAVWSKVIDGYFELKERLS
jgi:1-acyl-sn-glycerol-3-phosphate acyltransferase